jgi:hypothetical protein
MVKRSGQAAASRRGGVTPRRLRQLALAFPETAEGRHMGHPDFRVGGKKIFATLSADEATCALKCDPTNLRELVKRDPTTYRDAWGGRWLGVALDRIDEASLAELLEDAWCRTAAKKLVAQYRSESGDR